VLKENRKYLFIFLGLFALVIAAQFLLPKPVDWKRTYLAKDKSPFGCHAIYSLMDGVYSQTLTNNSQTLYNLKENLTGNSSLIIINDKINFNKTDLSSLFTILNKGNNIFIAANSFNGLMADTFHLESNFDFANYFASVDSLLKKSGIEVKLSAKNFSGKTYKYSQMAWVSTFTNFDSTKFSIIASDIKGNACVIKAKTGTGNLYLATVPDLFGNYFIVNNENREFAYALLSLLKNKNITWDEYYKAANVNKESPLKFILESDALYAAYLLLIFTLIVYMITEGRRRQRAIPVIEPVLNSTLEFVNVISHVYFNSKNHQSIAVERIKYFYENIRKKFSVNTDKITEELMNEIAALSGIELKLVKQLFTYCEKIKKSGEITEHELIELNRQISNFNKNSLR